MAACSLDEVAPCVGGDDDERTTVKVDERCLVAPHAAQLRSQLADGDGSDVTGELVDDAHDPSGCRAIWTTLSA